MMNFTEFCGGPFWNESLSWSIFNEPPDLTLCFQRTIPIWIPCGFFWLLLATYIYILSSTTSLSPTPVSKIHVTKLVIGLLLSILAFCEIIMFVMDTEKSPSDHSAYVLVASPLILGITLLVSMILMVVERRKGFVTSGFLFVFYLLLLCFGVIKFAAQIIELKYDRPHEDTFRIVSFFVHLPLVGLMLLLLCFADSHPDLEDNARMCPEAKASFLSRITYWWVTRLIVQGFRRELKEDDLFELHTRDQAKNTAPKFQKELTKKLNKSKLNATKRVHTTEDIFEHREPMSVNYSESDDRRPLLRSPSHQQPLSEDQRPSLVRVLLSVYGWQIMVAHLCKVVCVGLTFAGPLIQSQLIDFADDTEAPLWHGYFLAALFFVTAIVQSVFLQQLNHLSLTLGMRMRSALMCAVYSKTLTISNQSRKGTTVGEIVNLMSVDTKHIENVMTNLWLVWSCPMQITIAMFLLWRLVGVATLAGLAVLLIFLPMNSFLYNIWEGIEMKQMELKDRRIKLMNEILNGIKILKFYAWELSFKEKVDHIRNLELANIKQFQYVSVVCSLSWMIAPYLVMLATLLTYVMTGHKLDAKTAFVALTLFNILQFPLDQLPMLYSYIITAKVSLSRIGRYLCQPDINPTNVTLSPNEDHAIAIEDGTFTWTGKEDDSSVLQRINLMVKQGSLVAVVGPTGSGKSSLVSAILGEMEKPEGSVNISGSTAYVAQQAWIQNATLRDNILFGKQFDQNKYEEVIEACALTTDLEILAAGDKTEIGEKGINLSGGQKQRVALARAVYQDLDIYLLDDPLSAVDAHVGKHIFENIIGQNGLLQNKTRLLVTHGVQWLPMVDQIVVIDKGQITEIGSYEELVEKRGPFAHFLKTFSQHHIHENDSKDCHHHDTHEDDQHHHHHDSDHLDHHHHNSQDPDHSHDHHCHNDHHHEGDDHFEHDNEHHGSHDHHTHDHHTKHEDHHENDSKDNTNANGCHHHSDAAAFGCGHHAQVEHYEHHDKPDEVTKILSPEEEAIALKHEQEKKKLAELITAEKTNTGSVKLSDYMAYLKAVGGFNTFMVLFLYTLYQASSVMANIWLSKWADDPLLSNSSILSNNTDYIHKRDSYLGIYGGIGAIQGVLIFLYSVMFAHALIQAARILHSNMLKSILRSPMSFFDTTPVGRILNRFSEDIDTIDHSLPETMSTWAAAGFVVIASISVIIFATPYFTAVIIPLCILYYFIQKFYIPTGRQLKRLESVTRSAIYAHFSETISGASSVRAFQKQRAFQDKSQDLIDHNYAFYFANITSNRWLNFRLDLLGACVVFGSAIFAVVEKNSGITGGLVGLSISYALQATSELNLLVTMTSSMEMSVVAVERIREYSDLPPEADWVLEATQPPHYWPDRGMVQFNNYATRYRQDLDYTLSNITIQIKAGEKIGVCGRTGAGKSTLTLALFRIIEAATGTISIDGIPIQQLGLHHLRSQLTILPQDPVLFSGTLRMNLDPISTHTDAEIWWALGRAHLKTFVEGLQAGLDHECGEGGQNLSVGQRQLVCLARALLRKSKVLILDEATAAVDMETDSLIQETIRTEFKDCTVLTIAHRLNTILDSDRIIVMEKGKIVEFEETNKLLNDANSLFHQLALQEGLIKD